MKNRNVLYKIVTGLLLLLPVLGIVSCKNNTKYDSANALFKKMDSSETNINFINKLSYDSKFNVYTYRNFYNGGGVGIADINSDGLPDIFFTANMLPNKLYLNKGDFKFEDITEKAGIGKKGKWSTGVSMADVNGDGWIDIYVCNSGDVRGDNRENELYINNGNSTFTESAAAYGLNDKGLSTHAAFLDYDHDGDLDMFLLNNSFKAIGSFNLQKNERNVRDSVGGDKLFRNDDNHFTDVSSKAGIFGSVIGFGLGVTVGDLNNDGWDDIYVSNDFFERDYLYINQQNGTFKEDLENQMISISNASMGADMADVNNDARPDIFVTEMLPEDNASVKTKTTFENWDKYQLNIRYDYYHQFVRNMLQFNNGNNTFTDISRYGGVCATDWSWGALITDMDNDGLKDIFVANGIYQDLTNEDYIHYISSREMVQEFISKKGDYKKLIDLIPSNPISNYAFSNNGNLTFTNKAKEWGLAEPSFSNGAAYADLDNDGDLDFVINNVNMPSFVYQNKSRQKHPENSYLKIDLKGEGKNRYAFGTRVTVHYNGKIAYQEQMPVRGFESTVDHRLNFGLGNTQNIDSVVVDWLLGKTNIIKNVKPNSFITISEKEAHNKVENNKPSVADQVRNIQLRTAAVLFAPSNNNLGINFIHKENIYSDFDRVRLRFQMLSTQGPRIAKGDANHDGLEDIYVCGAQEQAGALYLQTKEGAFSPANQPIFEKNKRSEDTDALFFDADNDGDEDLYVCSGGSEYFDNKTDLISRLYINDGKGNFKQSPQMLPSFIFENSSCVRAADYDGDGDMDLFSGTRQSSAGYGYPARGYVLQNDGKGIFSDVTQQVAPELKAAGMITDAQWFDYDKDGKVDLVLTGEYMPIRIFKNDGNDKLKEQTAQAGLANTNGWWNRLIVADINNDGYSDLIVANHGLNSRFKAAADKPIEMYVGDFDKNGATEQIVTCYNGDRSYPMSLRHDLVGELPYLKKKYLKYEAYKDATIHDLFNKEDLKNAIKLQANEMQSCIFLNNKNGKFTLKPLPYQAQLSQMYGIVVLDYDADGKQDIVMGGNFYESKPEAGIYDGSYGVVLKGDGNGNFTTIPVEKSGISIRGAVRDIIKLTVKNKTVLVWGLNNSAIKVYSLN